MKKKWLFMIPSVLLAVSLIGCSTQTAETNGSPSETGTASAKVVEVALVNNNAPFEYADTDGTIKGFDYEALKKIDELIPEYEFHFQLVEYDAEVVGIQSGKYQIGAGNHFYTEERAETYLLSKAYDYNVIKLIVPEDSSINSLEDMDGKSVQPMPAYDGMYVVLQNFLEKNPDITIGCENAQLTTYADTFKGVNDGRWDAALVPEVAVVTDTLAEEQAQAIRDSFADVDGFAQADLVFETDTSEIIHHYTQRHTVPGDYKGIYASRPLFVLGSTHDRTLAESLGANALSISFPVLDRAVLDKGYAGFRGGIHLIEDLTSAVLAGR